MIVCFGGATFGGKAGPGVHATNVLRHLLDLCPQDQFFAFDSGRACRLHEESVQQLDPSGRLGSRTFRIPRKVLHFAQTYLRFPSMRWLLGEDYDLFHQMWVSTDPAVPSHKLVVSMYDTAALLWPGQDGTLFHGAGRMLRRAAAVTTLSEYSKRCIVEAFGVDPARVHVTYSGCNLDVYNEQYEQGQTQGLLDELKVRQPYLLFVGGQSPRKNLPRIISAFGAARREGKLPHSLVLAGPLEPLNAEVAEAIDRSECQASIQRLGYVPDDAIPHLYRGADALIFTTLFEGFGIPVVEAMACGTPVLTSTTSSLPEVAGDACMLVDPRSHEGICQGILRLLEEGGQARATRSQRGLVQARRFSWTRCAQKHVEIYRQVLELGMNATRLIGRGARNSIVKEAPTETR